MNDLEILQKTIGYTFKKPFLLEVALTHSSFKNEKNARTASTIAHDDNERLEFLGDTILSFILSEQMFLTFTEWNEGILSKYRSILVSKAYLFKIAREIKIARYLRLGKGEASGTIKQKRTMLANAIESLIAAIYLDGGMKHARAFISCFFGKYLNKRSLSHLDRNYKSTLQEYSQKLRKILPTYTTIEKKGFFHATVSIGKKKKGRGSGRSKREAEQEAAKDLLAKLKK